MILGQEGSDLMALLSRANFLSIWRLAGSLRVCGTPLSCRPWAKNPGTSTPMATSLRAPSFNSYSSTLTDTDDQNVRGTCEDASMPRGGTVMLSTAGLGASSPWITR